MNLVKIVHTEIMCKKKKETKKIYFEKKINSTIKCIWFMHRYVRTFIWTYGPRAIQSMGCPQVDCSSRLERPCLLKASTHRNNTWCDVYYRQSIFVAAGDWSCAHPRLHWHQHHHHHHRWGACVGSETQEKSAYRCGECAASYTVPAACLHLCLEVVRHGGGNGIAVFCSLRISLAQSTCRPSGFVAISLRLLSFHASAMSFTGGALWGDIVEVKILNNMIASRGNANSGQVSRLELSSRGPMNDILRWCSSWTAVLTGRGKCAVAAHRSSASDVFCSQTQHGRCPRAKLCCVSFRSHRFFALSSWISKANIMPVSAHANTKFVGKESKCKNAPKKMEGLILRHCRAAFQRKLVGHSVVADKMLVIKLGGGKRRKASSARLTLAWADKRRAVPALGMLASSVELEMWLSSSTTGPAVLRQ